MTPSTALALAALVFPLVAGATPAAAPSVVELFTSQGCSSCPPADAILGELAERPDVVALAFHVTYWDRIGWPDPFATDWGTGRQFAYGRALGSTTVYTPQMIVDGTADVVGSRRGDVDDALDASARQAPARVAVRLSRTPDGGLAVGLPAGPVPASAHVVLLRYDAAHRTAVRSGENAGRQLADANVVRALVDLGSWDGAERELKLDAPALTEPGGVAVLVQATLPGGLPGPILGAAKLALSPP